MPVQWQGLLVNRTPMPGRGGWAAAVNNRTGPHDQAAAFALFRFMASESNVWDSLLNRSTSSGPCRSEHFTGVYTLAVCSHEGKTGTRNRSGSRTTSWQGGHSWFLCSVLFCLVCFVYADAFDFPMRGWVW
jgi:hypothetical protein